MNVVVAGLHLRIVVAAIAHRAGDRASAAQLEGRRFDGRGCGVQRSQIGCQRPQFGVADCSGRHPGSRDALTDQVVEIGAWMEADPRCDCGYTFTTLGISAMTGSAPADVLLP